MNHILKSNVNISFNYYVFNSFSYQLTSLQAQRRSGLEQAARAFTQMNRITPENRGKFSTSAKRREEALINEANCIPAPNPNLGTSRRK